MGNLILSVVLLFTFLFNKTLLMFKSKHISRIIIYQSKAQRTKLNYMLSLCNICKSNLAISKVYVLQ